MSDIYETLDRGLYSINIPTANTEIAPEEISSGSIVASLNQVMNVVQSGKTVFDNTETGYILGLDKGVAKFYIGDSTSYLNWDGSTLTIVGGLSVDQLDIPDTVTANSFHVDVDGNTWWGATTFGAGVASVSKAGAAIFTSVTLSGTVTISGIANNTSTDISLLEKTHTIVFSVTDADTIAWAAGTITLSNGRTFSIDAGNTGNMAALTYIYLDPGASSTVLQTTTTAATAMGANKVLLGTAQNNTVTANFVPYGPGQLLVDGANIGALSIVAGNIAANAVTATKISVTNLAAINADMGAITAGSIVMPSGGLIRSGQTAYNTGTGFYLGNDSGTPKFSIGNSAANRLTWDGTTMTVVGAIQGGTLFAAGSQLLSSADTQRTELSTTYTKRKAITIYKGGTITVSFDGRAEGATTASFRIYVNDVAVGTERTDTTGVFVSWSESISGINAGDSIQLYAKNSVGDPLGATLRNFRISVDNYDSTLVVTN